MTKTEIKNLLSTLTKLISPALEVVGLLINNKVEYTFTSRNLDFMLNSVGNYGDYITIEPYFVLHNEMSENFISNNIQRISHVGLFNAGHKLANFLNIQDFNSTEFNNFDFSNFTYKYTVYNINDIMKCSIDIMKYMQTVGMKLVEISNDDKKLYEFYCNMILSKQEVISKPNFKPSDLIMTFGLEIIYCSIFLGVKNKLESKEELEKMIKEMYASNEIVINNIDKLSRILQ